MEWINDYSTLDMVMQSPPTWESLYEAAKHKINGHVDKYSTRPLPFEHKPIQTRTKRTSCIHLEPEPFKHFAWCTRCSLDRMIKESDCAKCRFYNPKTD